MKRKMITINDDEDDKGNDDGNNCDCVTMMIKWTIIHKL